MLYETFIQYFSNSSGLEGSGIEINIRVYLDKH